MMPTIRRAFVLSVVVLAATSVANADITHVIWTDSTSKEIHVGRLSDGDVSIIVPPAFFSPSAVEYDPVSQMIYYANRSGFMPSIRRVSLDGMVEELIVTGDAVDFTLDTAARKVYYLMNNHIWRADMDAADSNTQAFILFQDNMLSLAIDPVGGLIYWSTQSIKRAPINGGAVATLLAKGTAWVDGNGECQTFFGAVSIAVDPAQGLIYYVGGQQSGCVVGNNFSVIGHTTTSGGIPTILRTIDPQRKMAYDIVGGNIYYTDASPEIKRYNIATDTLTNVFTSLPNGGTAPLDIAVAEIPPVPCDGDANADGSVNFGDITSILGNWLQGSCPAGQGDCGAQGVQGDANNDGFVNFADITAVLGQWLGMCP